jgi:hypothetical protein
MRAIIFVILTWSSSVFAAESFSHDALDRVLQQFVDENGLVDYKGLKRQLANLNAYVAQIGEMSPKNQPTLFATDAHRLAYWLNVYNALAMKSVVEAYPVKSVRDIKWFYGFFNRTKHLVGQKEYTLKDIEHEIIRKQFPDPRIHAGLNCASMGCPKLPQKAYRGESLDADLEAHMHLFLREPRNVLIDRANKRLYLSKILDEFETDFVSWYKKQYANEKATIVDYLKLYVSEEDQKYLEKYPKIDIEYVKYDWRLNDQVTVR